jgi:hypothetical protein
MLQALTRDLAPGGSALASARNISAMEVYDNDHQLSGHQNCNMDTNLDSDIVSMNELMPAVGTGASGPGAQEVLLIVTDGFNDPAPERTFGPMDWDGSRCNAIKNRGIRIAVLYTTYYQALLAGQSRPGQTLYEDYSEWLPKLPKTLPPSLPSSTPIGSDPMALAAQQCASPGLYAQVNADGDISAAMQALFRQAVRTASHQQ